MNINRIGLEVPSQITLLETRFDGFFQEDRPTREELLVAIQESDTPYTIVDLPYHDFTKGLGAGFTKQIMSLMTVKYHRVSLLPVQFSHWGCPMDFTRLFIVGGASKITLPEVKHITSVEDWDPTVLYHTTMGLPFAKLKVGMISSTYGVVQSRLHPFADPHKYSMFKPVVARKEGDSYDLHLVTGQAWSSIYGVDVPIEGEDLLKLAPTSVLNSLMAYVATHPVTVGPVDEPASDPSPEVVPEADPSHDAAVGVGEKEPDEA